MNEKPWWVYACQIVIFACVAAIILMFGDSFSWSLGDSIPAVFGSQTIGLVMIGAIILATAVLAYRALTGKRVNLLEWLLDLF